MFYTLPDLWRLYRPGEVSADVVAAAAARRTPLQNTARVRTTAVGHPERRSLP